MADLAGDVKVARTRNPIGALKMLGGALLSAVCAVVLWKVGGFMARVESDSLIVGMKHPVGLTTLAFYGVSLLMGGLAVVSLFAAFWVVIVGVRGAWCPSCRAELDVREMPSTVRCPTCKNEYRVIT